MTWSAQQFQPNGQDLSETLTFVRLASDEIGPLTGPLLIIGKVDLEMQLKIVYGKQPMLFLTEFDAEDEKAVKELFVLAAKNLNEAEAEYGMKLEIEDAKRAAGAFLRSKLLGRQ
jgi:hypothetical protein